jgi:hypothetical protein
MWILTTLAALAGGLLFLLIAEPQKRPEPKPKTPEQLADEQALWEAEMADIALRSVKRTPPPPKEPDNLGPSSIRWWL